MRGRTVRADGIDYDVVWAPRWNAKSLLEGDHLRNSTLTDVARTTHVAGVEGRKGARGPTKIALAKAKRELKGGPAK